jgi:hypothetical protein
MPEERRGGLASFFFGCLALSEAAFFVRDDTTVYVCTYPFLSSLHLAMHQVCWRWGSGRDSEGGRARGILWRWIYLWLFFFASLHFDSFSLLL